MDFFLYYLFRLIFPIFIVGYGVSTLLSARSFLKLKKLILDTPTSKIRDLRPGLAEVKGKVKAATNTLTSPLSKKQCVFYQFTVDQYSGGSSNSSGEWHRVVTDSDSVTCLVDDGTGQVELDFQDCDLTLAEDQHLKSGTWNSPPKKVQKLLKERYELSTKGWVFNKELRYSETVLELNDNVFVIGHVVQGEERAAFRSQRSFRCFVTDERDETTVINQLSSSANFRHLFGSLIILGGLIFGGYQLAKDPGMPDRDNSNSSHRSEESRWEKNNRVARSENPLVGKWQRLKYFWVQFNPDGTGEMDRYHNLGPSWYTGPAQFRYEESNGVITIKSSGQTPKPRQIVNSPETEAETIRFKIEWLGRDTFLCDGVESDLEKSAYTDRFDGGFHRVE